MVSWPALPQRLTEQQTLQKLTNGPTSDSTLGGAPAMSQPSAVLRLRSADEGRREARMPLVVDEGERWPYGRRRRHSTRKM